MVLVIKEKSSFKPLIKKTLALLVLVGMFWAYYHHMSSEFQAKNEKIAKELEKSKNKKMAQLALTKKLEKLIYNEAESCVDIIGQEKIQSIKIEKDKLYIVCDWDTDIEPLFIRYGVMALVKSTPQNIKIAIDLKFIVESNYEA